MSDIECDDFRWTVDNADVVLWEQPTTAVYRNSRNQIVVRQERDAQTEDDPYVVIAVHNVDALIVGLRKVVAEIALDAADA
jgi:hypothetical protein